jgi:hypothetical protein
MKPLLELMFLGNCNRRAGIIQYLHDKCGSSSHLKPYMKTIKRVTHQHITMASLFCFGIYSFPLNYTKPTCFNTVLLYLINGMLEST